MKYNFWFIVGSQFLYGPEVLETVEIRAKEMAEQLSKSLPHPLISFLQILALLVLLCGGRKFMTCL